MNRMMMRKLRKGSSSGQAIVEYIIIIVVVAVAALAVMGAFSDRVRGLISGATEAIGGKAKEQPPAVEMLQKLQADGSGIDLGSDN